MIEVPISERAWQRCVELVEKNEGTFGRGGKRVMDLTLDEILFRGYVVEWAVAEASGGQWTGWDREPGADPGWDLISPSGRKVDAKQTKFGQNLAVPYEHEASLAKCDALALGWFENGHSAMVVGWVTVEQFRRDAERADWLPYPGLLLRWRELEPFDPDPGRCAGCGGPNAIEPPVPALCPRCWWRHNRQGTLDVQREAA